jgi:hypothetical protein
VEEEISMQSKLTVLTAALLILGFAIPVGNAKDASGTQGYVMAADDQPSDNPGTEDVGASDEGPDAADGPSGGKDQGGDDR